MRIPNINTIERYAKITALPDWVCPNCGKNEGKDIIDCWPPVYGPIATECDHCGCVDMGNDVWTFKVTCIRQKN